MTDIDRMEAGPEMDRLVSQALLNYRPDGVYTCMGVITTGEWSPSTNITHAWEVVERMLPLLPSKPFDFIVNIQARLGVYECHFIGAKTVSGATDHEGGMPLAICRAALKALSP